MTSQAERENNIVKYSQNSVKKPVKLKRKSIHKPSHSAIVTKKVFIIVLFILAQLIFYYSDFFKLKEIKIHGNNQVSSELILKTAAIPMEHNIVTLPVKLFQDKLKSIHWIKDVKVNWKLPGRLNIFVVERTPIILARQNGKPNSWFTLDNEGMTLYRASPKEIKKFPRMVNNEKYQVGKFIPKKDIKEVIKIDKFLPIKLKKDSNYYIINKIYIDKNNKKNYRAEVALFTKLAGKPFKIKIGTSDNIAQKMKRLNIVMDLFEKNNIKKVKYLDIRFNEPVIFPDKKKPKLKN